MGQSSAKLTSWTASFCQTWSAAGLWPRSTWCRSWRCPPTSRAPWSSAGATRNRTSQCPSGTPVGVFCWFQYPHTRTCRSVMSNRANFREHNFILWSRQLAWLQKASKEKHWSDQAASIWQHANRNLASVLDGRIAKAPTSLFPTYINTYMPNGVQSKNIPTLTTLKIIRTPLVPKIWGAAVVTSEYRDKYIPWEKITNSGCTYISKLFIHLIQTIQASQKDDGRTINRFCKFL